MVLLSHLSLTFYPKLHNFHNLPYQNQPLQEFIHHSPLGFFFSGTAAVFIFFVLSGYILTYVAFRREDVTKQILSMSIKRYPRLMLPAVVSCIFAFWVITLLRADTSHLSSWINEYGTAADYSLSEAIYTGTISAFIVTGINPYNPVLWTMKVELIGSLMIFLHAFLWLRLESKRAFLDLTAVVLCLLLVYSGWLLPQLSYGISGFYLGYLSYRYGRNISGLVAIPLLFTGLYLAGFHSNSAAYSALNTLFGEQGYLLSNFMAGPLIVYSALFYRPLRQLFSGKITVFLGKVSFSAYLLHMLVIITFSADMFNYLQSGGLDYDSSALLSISLSLVCIYLLSWVFYYLVDFPCMTLSQRLAKAVVK